MGQTVRSVSQFPSLTTRKAYPNAAGPPVVSPSFVVVHLGSAAIARTVTRRPYLQPYVVSVLTQSQYNLTYR